MLHRNEVNVRMADSGSVPKEVSDALSLGFIPVSLGNSRLRTETAAVVACHTAVLMNE